MITLQFFFAIGFLYLTCRSVNFKLVATSIANINYWVLAFALVPQGISFLLLAAREKYLLSDLYTFSFIDLMKGVFISFVGNNILPLRAGEFLKAYYWANRSGCAYVSLMSIALLERVLDLIVLVILFFVGSKTILVHLGVHSSWLIFACLIIAIMIFLLFLWDKKTNQEIILHPHLQTILGKKISQICQHFLSNVVNGLRVLKSTRYIVFAMLFTILYWIMNLAGLYLMLQAFHLSFTLSEYIVLLLATSLGAAIPSAPGYIGTYDYFTKMPLVFYGINASIAVSFALISHALQIIPFTIIGLFFVLGPIQSLLKSKQFNSQ